MPIYDYLCTAGHRFERLQKFADEPLKVCETCGKPAQRVLHAPAVHFKGKGFYATDYGRRKSGNGDKGESGSSSESGSKEAAASSSSSSSSSNGSDSSSSSKSDSKSSESKSSSSDSSSSSKKSDSSKPAA